MSCRSSPDQVSTWFSNCFLLYFYLALPHQSSQRVLWVLCYLISVYSISYTPIFTLSLLSGLDTILQSILTMKPGVLASTYSPGSQTSHSQYGARRCCQVDTIVRKRETRQGQVSRKTRRLQVETYRLKAVYMAAQSSTRPPHRSLAPEAMSTITSNDGIYTARRGLIMESHYL